MNKLVKESIQFKRGEDIYQATGIGTKSLIEQWLNKYEINSYYINDNLTIDVEGDVDISEKELNILPDYIKFNVIEGRFYCYNNNLISLKGCPQIVYGSFACYLNNLTSLEGCPYIVSKDFWCSNNKVKFTEEYVRSICDVGKFVKV